MPRRPANGGRAFPSAPSWNQRGLTKLEAATFFALPGVAQDTTSEPEEIGRRAVQIGKATLDAIRQSRRS